jgi:TolB-like protein/Tfp pilus assembly protein PilF
MITVQLLGGACLRSGNTLLGGPPAQRHRIALLALVVTAWPQPLSRDRAMALLWPERDTARARRLLNLAVHVLRAALGEDAIVSTGDGLLLQSSSLSCDLHELRAAIAADDPERVVRLYTGPLLDGFHLDDSTDFGYWLDECRSELAHAYTSALLEVAGRQERSGDLQGRVGSCRRLVASDPYSGVYARALMRSLDAAGDRAGAMQHASDHARRLRADLDLGPDPEVVAFAAELRASPARRAPGSLAAPRTPSPAVAVLPFVSLDAGAGTEYFADGITEDVIAHLSKIRALKVIARGSVMPFKQRRPALKDIGRMLGTATLLDGSVRHAGESVRIVANLIDVENDRQLWAETYDRKLTDIFAIQTDVALNIAAALEAELLPGERARVGKQPTRDLGAYQLYLRGRQSFIEFTASSLRSAIDSFERAIARDPTFALAYASVAMTYIELMEMGAMAHDHAFRRASEAAATALDLDPDLGAAYCAMGYLEAVWSFDWSGAERDFERALELSPGSADTYDLYGRLLAALERYDEAIALLERARELDPLAHRLDIATALLRAGRLDEALQSAKAAVDLDSCHDRSHATLGWAYFLTGRREEGIAELERAASLSTDHTLWRSQLAEAHAMAGNTAKALEILRELEERARSGYVSPYHFAYIYTGLHGTRRRRASDRLAGTRGGGAHRSGVRDQGLVPVHAAARAPAIPGAAPGDEAGMTDLHYVVRVHIGISA